MMRQSLETFRSLRWLDYIYYALLEPRRLPSRIADETSKPTFGAVLVVIGISFFEILASSLLVVNTAYFYYKITYGLLLVFIINIVQIAIIVLLIDGLFQYMDLEGKVKILFPLVAYAQFPKIFLLPLVYIVKVISFAPIFFGVTFSLGLTVWSALIVSVGISEVHSMPFTKAFLIFLFPYVAIAVIIFFITMLVIINAFGYFVS